MFNRLSVLYDAREARSIAVWVMNAVTGYTKTEQMLRGGELLLPEQMNRYSHYLGDLERSRPVQYVLGEAWFGPLKLYTDERVLIPRPETEELVDWIIMEEKGRHLPEIVDIGTGSGCIPILLKQLMPQATVHAIDISAGALEVAQLNASTNQVNIQLHQTNILEETEWSRFPLFDIIVSNPPYIKESERQDMQRHVLDYEPASALFVPDEDPLLFYRYIARFAGLHLKEGGSLYFEINEALGFETLGVLDEIGYTNSIIKKDMQGKDRMVRAIWRNK